MGDGDQWPLCMLDAVRGSKQSSACAEWGHCSACDELLLHMACIGLSTPLSAVSVRLCWRRRARRA
jgi:hypothetical protein